MLQIRFAYDNTLFIITPTATAASTIIIKEFGFENK